MGVNWDDSVSPLFNMRGKMPTVKGIAKSVTPANAEVLGESKGRMSPELKRFMDEEAKLVTGRFKNYESPGGQLPFTGGKYPGHPVFSQTFQDGETYKVPLWVARWLNGIDVTAKAIDGKIGSCSYPIHGFKWDAGKSAPESTLGEGGVPVSVVGIAKRKQRYGFESLEFNPGR